jgi:hypothetical protein
MNTPHTNNPEQTTEDLAKELYYAYTDHDPYLHSNRAAIWEEMKPQYQDQWVWVARKAFQSINANKRK